jgi:DNA-directed RNA polymerase subunit alpha
MEQILLPSKIEYTAGDAPNQTIVTIEPLYPGYGTTIGTALRRVLLSSLSGGAVVAVKIKGVQHEFSTIPYVQEDVVDIILNIKKLRFKVHTDETVRLLLQVKGEKDVTGADIQSSNDAEVANPDCKICTLTNKNAQLEMEVFVKRGRGYWPTEMREKEKLEIGTIAIDALYTSIRSVGLNVENVRVGQMTNYNKVVLTIETDGSITGEEAMREASSILLDHFKVFATGESDMPNEEATDELEAPDVISGTLNEDGDASDEDEDTEDAPKKRGRPKKGA